MDEQYKKAKYIIADESKENRKRIKFNQLLADLSRRNKNVSKTINSYSNNTDIEKLNLMITIHDRKKPKPKSRKSSKRTLKICTDQEKNIPIQRNKDKLKTEIHNKETEAIDKVDNSKKSNTKKQLQLSQINLSYKKIPKNSEKNENNYTQGETEKILNEIEEIKSENRAVSLECSTRIKNSRVINPNIGSFIKGNVNFNTRIVTLPHLYVSSNRKFVYDGEIINNFNNKLHLQKEFDHFSLKLRKNMSKISLISSLPPIKVRSIKTIPATTKVSPRGEKKYLRIKE